MRKRISWHRPRARVRRWMAYGFFALVLVPLCLFVTGAFQQAAAQQRRQTRPTPLPVDVSGVATVMDGNTLLINGQRVRLAGIEAAESGQACVSGFGRPYECGRAATLFLEQHTRNQPVRCRVLGRSSTGRLVGRCVAGGLDLAAGLVRGGWAFAFRSLGDNYLEQESLAQATQLGVWSGLTQTPLGFRDRIGRLADQGQALGRGIRPTGNPF